MVLQIKQGTLISSLCVKHTNEKVSNELIFSTNDLM
jgi:hypothetical protein